MMVVLTNYGTAVDSNNEQYDDNNPWNLSNDKYYRVLPGAQNRLLAAANEHNSTNFGCPTIRHTRPAIDLWRNYFPTYLNEERLRNFHRPKLRRYSRGRLANNKPQGVKCLTRHIVRRHLQLRARVISSINAGWPREEIINKHLLMSSATSLTPKYGELLFFEYMEEHPPLLNQVGMASNIKNYFWPKSNDQKFTQTELKGTYEHGISDIVLSSEKPFLGTMKPGRSVQALVNNMFRAPIYRHNMPECDFLIIRTRDSYYIRTVETIFTVGQQLPLIGVPCEPKPCVAAKKFWLDLFRVHISRLFSNSEDNPKRLRHSDLVKAFPYDASQNIRRRLQRLAYFERINSNDGYWILEKKNHNGTSMDTIPSENERRKILRPEQCCAYYSMLAAEQRLNDAGYQNSRLTPKYENDEKSLMELDDEIKAAPWNTTKALIAAQEGKCYLDLRSHVADPTGKGCREGFSYIKLSKTAPITAPETSVEQQKSIPPSTSSQHNTTLPCKTSTPIVKKTKLSNSPFPLTKKSPLLQTQRKEKLERLAIYQKESQRLFELQNTVLSSAEILSSDEYSDSSDDENDKSLEQSTNDLKKILIEDQSTTEFYHEKEEEERIALMKEFFGVKSTNGTSNKQIKPVNSSQSQVSQDHNSVTGSPHKRFLNIVEGDEVLRIHRTYENDGEFYQRVETVRRPAVIDMYIKKKVSEGKHASISRNAVDSPGTPSTSKSSIYAAPSSQTCQRSRKSLTLEKGELIKIENTRMVVSKRVMEQSRRLRHSSRKNYNYGPA